MGRNASRRPDLYAKKLGAPQAARLGLVRAA